MQYTSEIDVKSLFGGLIIFSILYASLSYFTRISVEQEFYSPEVVTIGGYLVWILTGYLSGYISKKTAIINGAVIGIFSPLIISAYIAIGLNFNYAISALLDQGFNWLIFGFILCGIGGLVLDIQRKYTAKIL